MFHADFLRANLSGAKLDRVIASNASFTSASFIKATLTNTHFGAVDLTTVNFRNAKNAYFPEAILKDTIMPDGSLQSS
ncbi:pentapeptide repeat-containing protein [Nostoc sp.]|uniref:pentapeptide repeat-containing protein n=1 Tax=Nostoc sp. TaxID=1180 RepID=UPI002FF9AE2E